MASYGPLVDTSILIDYFAGIDNRESDLLDSLLANGPPPATARIIVQEYLQGLSTVDEFVLARADLDSFESLPSPDYPTHIRAAEWHVRMPRCSSVRKVTGFEVANCNLKCAGSVCFEFRMTTSSSLEAEVKVCSKGAINTMIPWASTALGPSSNKTSTPLRTTVNSFATRAVRNSYTFAGSTTVMPGYRSKSPVLNVSRWVMPYAFIEATSFASWTSTPTTE